MAEHHMNPAKQLLFPLSQTKLQRHRGGDSITES